MELGPKGHQPSLGTVPSLIHPYAQLEPAVPRLGKKWCPPATRYATAAASAPALAAPGAFRRQPGAQKVRLGESYFGYGVNQEQGEKVAHGHVRGED